jgi:hypothetical protein
LGRLSDYKDSFLEVAWIARNALTTFWFWFPIIYMAYVFLQLWLMFYVHPITLAILPVTLVIYGVYLDDKRVKLRYGLQKTKRLSTDRPLGSAPEPVKQVDWQVEQSVEQYERMLKKQKQQKKK